VGVLEPYALSLTVIQTATGPQSTLSRGQQKVPKNEYVRVRSLRYPSCASRMLRTKIGATMHTRVGFVFSALSLMCASAFAQPTYRPPGPPFYRHDAPQDVTGTTQPACHSGDGSGPNSLSTINGEEICES
jgi:hypothetical protein